MRRTESFSLNAGQRCYVTRFLLSSKGKPSCDSARKINHATPFKEGTLALFAGALFTVNTRNEDRDVAAALHTVESPTFIHRYFTLLHNIHKILFYIYHSIYLCKYNIFCYRF